MSKNKLGDLNDHLFAQMERLLDNNLKGDELKAEIERTKSTTGLAKEMISVAALALEGEKYMHSEGLSSNKRLPPMMQEPVNLRAIGKD
jgi:hypothetical protein